MYIHISMKSPGELWARGCLRAYACDRVRAPTMRQYAACVRARRALFVRPSIDGTRTGIAYAYTLHACIYIHARLATPMNGSPMRARRTHAPTCCVRARASARTPASAFRRRRPRVARRAGVLLYVGVQREHRRVEHRECHHVGLGMRRHFGPAAPPMRMYVCVCADVWARACAGAHVCRYSCA